MSIFKISSLILGFLLWSVGLYITATLLVVNSHYNMELVKQLKADLTLSAPDRLKLYKMTKRSFSYGSSNEQL
jgi:hypothetical protein